MPGFTRIVTIVGFIVRVYCWGLLLGFIVGAYCWGLLLGFIVGVGDDSSAEAAAPAAPAVLELHSAFDSAWITTGTPWIVVLFEYDENFGASFLSQEGLDFNSNSP